MRCAPQFLVLPMRCFMKRRYHASRIRGVVRVSRASDYPAWPSACAMRRPLGSLCVCAGTMAACDACKSVAGLPCGTAVASRCCRSGGFWYVPVTLSIRHGPSSRRVRVTRQVISWRVSSSAGAALHKKSVLHEKSGFCTKSAGWFVVDFPVRNLARRVCLGSGGNPGLVVQVMLRFGNSCVWLCVYGSRR